MQAIAIVTLYLTGLVGLHDVVCDLQGGPIRTWRAWAGLVFWPLMVPIAKIGDLYDAWMDR